MTPDSQKLRNEWYRPFDFCCPEHNMWHAQNCKACQVRLAAQFQREVVFVKEIYRLEREAEGILVVDTTM